MFLFIFQELLKIGRISFIRYITSSQNCLYRHARLLRKLYGALRKHRHNERTYGSRREFEAIWFCGVIC